MTARQVLLLVLAISALGTPFVALSQQPAKTWRVGYLHSAPALTAVKSGTPDIFKRGMQDLGYVEGKNLVVEWRFGDGGYERLPSLAAELVKLRVDVIVANSSPAIRAAQKATSTIPIVMATTGDPVGSGFVVSLARPGGNITGLSNAGTEISAKQLELLVAVVPKLTRVAVLANPESSTYLIHMGNIKAAGQKANIQIVPMQTRTPREIEQHFSSMRRDRIDGVIVVADAFLMSQGAQIAELATMHRLPTIHGGVAYVQANGLISYTHNIPQHYLRAAIYVDKIFKGENPATLPVEEPTRYELVVNTKTAKSLGLTIPQTILVRADRVIE